MYLVMFLENIIVCFVFFLLIIEMSYFDEIFEIQELKNEDDNKAKRIKNETRFKLIFNRNYVKSPRGLVRLSIIVFLTPLWLIALFLNKEENKYYLDWAGYELTRISYIIVTVTGQVISLAVYFIYTFSIDRINSCMKLYFPFMVSVFISNIAIIVIHFVCIYKRL
jgi:hypothetical protein